MNAIRDFWVDELKGVCCTGVNAEQNALIDFLVLVKCNKFVGFSPSTFSYFIREYRTLTGIQQDRSHLLKVPSINSEILFNATAVIS